MSLSAVSSYPLSASVDSLVPVLPTENATTAAELSKTQGGKHLTMFAEGDDEASFWDFLDVINPLQHIPIVNNLYREATGDKIGVAARLIGGTLFAGGPIGFATAAANCMLEESTGNDAGGHLLALFRDDEAVEDTGTALAAAQPKSDEAPAEAAKEVATAAPAPEAQAKAQPLMLDLVGTSAEPPVPVAVTRPALPAAEAVSAAPAPAAPVQVAQAPTPEAVAEAAKPAQRGMAIPGRGDGRLMPIPGRTVPLATKSPPPIGTSISTTGYRSNAPIVGHRPEAQRTANVAAAQQQMVAAQADASAAAPSHSAAPGGGDWFTANMMQAMDKYERGNRLSKPTQSTVSEMQ